MKAVITFTDAAEDDVETELQFYDNAGKSVTFNQLSRAHLIAAGALVSLACEQITNDPDSCSEW